MSVYLSAGCRFIILNIKNVDRSVRQEGNSVLGTISQITYDFQP